MSRLIFVLFLGFLLSGCARAKLGGSFGQGSANPASSTNPDSSTDPVNSFIAAAKQIRPATNQAAVQAPSAQPAVLEGGTR